MALHGCVHPCDAEAGVIPFSKKILMALQRMMLVGKKDQKTCTQLESHSRQLLACAGFGLNELRSG